MAKIQLLSVVALMRDIPDRGLVRGQVGTIVEVLAHGVFEVEFSAETGATYASLPLSSKELLPLQYKPHHEAA